MFPLVLLIFMTLVQWGLYFHASQVADAAAQDAARAAQASGGSEVAASAAAEDVLGDARGSGLLHGIDVSVSGDARSVTVTVTGEVRSLIPLPLRLKVRGVAGGPLEQFVGEPDRP